MAAASEPQDEPNSHLGLLYRLYRNALLRFLTRRVGQDDAADLLQEAFIRMARAKADPRPVRNDKAFLFQVASNLAADHGREQRRRSRLLTGNEIATILAIPDDTARPADAALARLEGQRLARALAEMPPRRAEAFRLSRLEGLSHGAIAVRLGVSVRTVEAEIRMALDHCAERLGRTQPDR